MRHKSNGDTDSVVDIGTRNIGVGNVGCRNAGNNNIGSYNTGSHNTGDDNAGSNNSGDRNVGDGNVGCDNVGCFNYGNYNTGVSNIGDFNAGEKNFGTKNAGDYNVGDRNTGDWNLCNGSSGVFNTRTTKIRMFDRPSEWTYDDWCRSRARSILEKAPFSHTVWVFRWKMTAVEKACHKDYAVVGGYLKYVKVTSSERQHWWNNLSPAEQQEIMSLPNFDPVIFERITGINTIKK